MQLANLLLYCFRQIALKALSERLSKSYSDKQPLLPTTSTLPKVALPPTVMQSSATASVTSQVHQQNYSATIPSTLPSSTPDTSDYKA